MNKITVKTIIDAPIEKVWDAWTNPLHITKWAFASDEWEAPEAENDVRIGGSFKTRMQSKDGSEKFDFTGVYTNVEKLKTIEYDMADGRHVSILFEETPKGVSIVETFDPENENSEDVQRSGWQAILENFKSYVER